MYFKIFRKVLCRPRLIRPHVIA